MQHEFYTHTTGNDKEIVFAVVYDNGGYVVDYNIDRIDNEKAAERYMRAFGHKVITNAMKRGRV